MFIVNCFSTRGTRTVQGEVCFLLGNETNLDPKITEDCVKYCNGDYKPGVLLEFQ